MSADQEPSLAPAGGGWHCSHLYYRFDRGALAQRSAEQRSTIAAVLRETLDPQSAWAPTRLQTTIISGQKADFGVMMMDPDPLKIDAVHQRLMSGPAGGVLQPAYSFVSVTEISEYVPTVEQYAQRLAQEGDPPESPAHQAKVKAYGDRLEGMNRQRLTPEFPPYKATCFYPMNKARHPAANWFTLSKEERGKLMGEHARSGMAFAGRVSQLITVALGFDDWEWGVTLWAGNPEYLKDIVYQMRFDEASARYAQFGSFYVGYVATPQEILEHCRVLS
ncbi:putative heme peroxidase [Pirellulimonas nuda]|uniref:Putative heme peroxidase n=1 Tax=Pirellulimonas nuda TaxID=2528009 RepID=A0A518DES8_9BACT|nr:hydrogen peroxide-dependent heme synthase [Pirellulimonas nuda]QDU89942.1 putative heme peroxidase [Pirellulimonas nuda]